MSPQQLDLVFRKNFLVLNTFDKPCVNGVIELAYVGLLACGAKEKQRLSRSTSIFLIGIPYSSAN